MADLYESTVCCTPVHPGVWGEGGGGVEMRKSERERRAQRKRRKGRRKYTIVSLSSSLVRRSGGKKQLKPPPFHWPLLDCGCGGGLLQEHGCDYCTSAEYSSQEKRSYFMRYVFLPGEIQLVLFINPLTRHRVYNYSNRLPRPPQSHKSFLILCVF